MDISKVYSHGNHFIGPDYEFKKFRADFHNVDLEYTAAFTRDRLEVRTSNLEIQVGGWTLTFAL